MVDTKDLFRIGVITEPHGVRGEVKVYPTTDDVSRIKKLKEVILNTGKELVTVTPKSVRNQGNLIIIKFDEINDRDEATKLRKKELFVTRDNAVKLEEGEYYIADLVGLNAIDEEGNSIGVLTDVFRTGANDVYEIEKVDGEKLYLPAIKDCILEVNVPESYIKVYVLPGL